MTNAGALAESQGNPKERDASSRSLDRSEGYAQPLRCGLVLCLIHPGERPIVFPQDERPGLAADGFLIHDDLADLWPGRDGREGMAYITSNKADSMIERSPRAPILRRSA